MTDHDQFSLRAFLWVQLVTACRVPLALAYATTLLAYGDFLYASSVCLTLLILLELTDLLDGWLARRLGVTSRWGEAFDPYVDSISRLCIFSALAFEDVVLMAVPATMVLRDITVAYCRIICAGSGREVAANLSGKIKAVVQGTSALVLTILAFSHAPIGHARLGLSVLVLIVTIASSVQYIAGSLRAASKAVEE